jgi:hypothetical protein
MTGCLRLFGWIGLTLLGSSLVVGQVPLYGLEAASGAEVCNNARDNCCAHCGCRLVSVCQIGCTTKKVTEYKYSYVCETICIPGVTPILKKSESCNGDCQNACGGRCTVKEVKKLVKWPVTKEVPVRTCTVQWVCPNGCDDGGQSAPAPAVAPVPPAPPVRPAPAPKGLPPGPKAVDAAPLPSDISSVQVR